MMGFKTLILKMLPDFFVEWHLYRNKYKEMKYEMKLYHSNNMIPYLKSMYLKRVGEELNIDNPKKLTEKQQWMKFNISNEIKKICSDKFAVREYISNNLVDGQNYLIELIRNNGKEIFNDANEINYDELPNSFVIQCNHGCGMTYVVKDKNKLGKKGFKKLQHKLNRDLRLNFAFVNGFELYYKDIKPCIFITKYLEFKGDLYDYKFMCFNGKVCYVWVDSNRFSGHTRVTYNSDFTKAPFEMGNFKKGELMSKPKNYEIMVDLAEKLSSKISDYVRVDLYNVDGKIYFGELTFSSGSGFEYPNPKEWNYKLGQMLSIDNK